MKIYLESQDGTRYSDFITITVEKRLDSLSRSFSVELGVKAGNSLPFKGGEACSIYVGDQKLLTGHIEIVGASYSAEGEHAVLMQGRSLVGDLLDSNLGPISDIKSPITLKQVIEKVIDHLGMSISVIDNANPEPFIKSEDIVAPEPGERSFDFIEKYSRKRQVLLTDDPEGNIVIQSTDAPFVNHPLVNVEGGTGNNIIQGQFQYNGTGRFQTYKFTSALNPVALNFVSQSDLGAVVDQNGEATDLEISRPRQMVMIPEASATSKNCQDRAQWEASIRKTRSISYSVNVDGFLTYDGEMWELNRKVSVLDEFAGIDSTMLVNTVSYHQNLDKGSITTLGLVNPNSYSLSLSEPKAEKIGDGIFG